MVRAAVTEVFSRSMMHARPVTRLEAGGAGQPCRIVSPSCSAQPGGRLAQTACTAPACQAAQGKLSSQDSRVGVLSMRAAAWCCRTLTLRRHRAQSTDKGLHTALYLLCCTR